MPYKDIEKRRECQRNYQRSKKGRATAKRSRALPKYRAAQKRYEQANPEKKSAHYFAKRIPRVECSVEGCIELGERHHPDYSKPLEVESLCRQHHADLINEVAC